MFCLQHAFNMRFLLYAPRPQEIMARDDWHQIQVPKTLTAEIQSLMDAGVIVGFTRPAQFYSHAAMMEIRRLLEDARLKEELLRRGDAHPPLDEEEGQESPPSEIAPNGS